MELYVIDENATIVATTYPRKLGLNFSEFAPYFAEYLGQRSRTLFWVFSGSYRQPTRVPGR